VTVSPDYENSSAKDRFSREQSIKVVKEILALLSAAKVRGNLITIFGPCYSGKTLTSILLCRAWVGTEDEICVTQPAIHRPGDIFDGFIQARNGETFPATSFSTPEEIHRLFRRAKVVLINEFQFTPENLQDVLLDEILTLRERRGSAILAGLYFSSLRTVFPFAQKISHDADVSFALKAICENCAQPAAVYCQRLVNGKPAPATAPLFSAPSDEVVYVPRCSNCHTIS
jgi:thymidine kinase